MRILTWLLFCGIALNQELVYVEIQDSDIEFFGQWPIPKRYYAVLAEKAFELGFSRVFIDAAFPHADKDNPISDAYFEELFYREAIVIRKNEGDYFLGKNMSQKEKFWGNFDEQITIGPYYIQFKNEADNALERGNHYYPFPTKKIPKIGFKEFLQRNERADNALLLIGFNLSGKSSYLQLKEHLILNSSEISAYVLNRFFLKLKSVFIPTWCIIIFYFILLLFLQLKKYPLYLNVAVLIASSLTIILVQIIFPLLFDIRILILSSLISTVIATLITKGKVQIKIREIIKKDPSDIQKLENKLAYYENLKDSAEDIRYDEINKFVISKDSTLHGVLTKAKSFAESDISILLYGESGTGKELLAEFIHNSSSRRNENFQIVHCAAIPENLIESELFGHKAGAFTGALSDRKGRFESAHKGSLFLDEIADIPLSVQIKLLRVLQEKKIERLGENRLIDIDIRIIAASHKNLKDEIKAGRFREDLYYRIAGVQLDIPPLRDRKNDIEVLFYYFKNKYDTDKHCRFSENILEYLKEYSWPGNIREFERAVQRAVINAKQKASEIIHPLDFELPFQKKLIQKDEIADKILESLRQKEFRHQAISETASEHAIHRITVTEYLKGWILHFYAESHNKDDFYSLLYGKPNYDEKFKTRIDRYLNGMLEKMNRFTEHEQLLKEGFYNLPKIFTEDLFKVKDQK